MLTDVKPSTTVFRPEEVTRPESSLLTYYILCSLLSGPLFPVVLVPLICKYLTLRYQFDDEGIAVRWGVLFRREVYLTYRRIQDIHLTNNLVQRWLGLATVSIQTASGSATPETTIEGVREFEALRDYLYAKMRGAKSGLPDGEASVTDARQSPDAALELLTEIRDQLQKLVQKSTGGAA